jgi:hypothetical protein
VVDEISREYGINGWGVEKYFQGFGWETGKDIDLETCVCIGWRIILKWISKK